ncbi:MAG: mobile mystery protein B [Bacteroidetes bacterium]|nr:MAG: mobile mystery protein B [Bacteroidota bacterium]
MGLDLNYENGQTPLEEEEKEGLLIPSITTREDLDEFEQLNIEKAVEWYLVRKKFRKENILTEKFILDVHKKMFNDVWSWAGKFRKTNKNIGVDKHQIYIRLRQLIDDCKYWINHETYSDEEIAIRFKHELVSIHLFPNGNGRHSRLMADIMMKNIFKKPIFSWGQKNLVNKSSARKQYIKSLKNADNGIINDLIGFAVS